MRKVNCLNAVCAGLRCQVSVFSNSHLGKVRPYAYLHLKHKSCTVRNVQIKLPYSGWSHLINQIWGLLNSISGPFPSESKTWIWDTDKVIYWYNSENLKMSTSRHWGSSSRREVEEVPVCIIQRQDSRRKQLVLAANVHFQLCKQLKSGSTLASSLACSNLRHSPCNENVHMQKTHHLEDHLCTGHAFHHDLGVAGGCLAEHLGADGG